MMTNRPYAFRGFGDRVKMADFRRFRQLRTLRSRAFRIDNGSRERHALPAFRLASQGPVRLAGAAGTAPCGRADIAFFDGITDAYDHVRPSL
jgi:hypothetical protein